MLPIILMYVFLIPCAALFVYFKYIKRPLLATIFKGAATFAILCAALAGKADGLPVFAALIPAGLAMGLSGDVALSLPEHGFKAGIVFFAIGHICYISALVSISNRILLAVAAFVVLYIIILILYKISKIQLGKMLIPIIAYSVIITIMLSFAITTPFSIFPGGLVLLFAGILFVVSDALLATEAFSFTNKALVTLTPEEERGIISLSCYFLGQSLFAVSIFLIR